MRSLLTRAHYHAPEIFRAECDQLFRKLWMLAAIRPMVAKPNDFRTVQIAGVPVVVQNMAGKVRAFSNTCRHRLSRIQLQDIGNRPLVCPYHHWSYGNDGELASVPRNAQMFQFDERRMSDIRLDEYAVEVVGGLVFVNLDPDPIPITAQFNAATLDVLRSSTDLMDDEFVFGRYEVAFNWKAGMENIKDPLHVSCLHRQTFPDHIRLDLEASASIEGTGVDHDAPAARTGMTLEDSTSIYDVPIDPSSMHEWQRLVERTDSKGNYRGIHLFPNVNLMIVDGSSFSVQVYNPLAADRTEMHMMVALTRAREPFDYRPVVLWEHIKSDMTVLNEDIVCLEAMQKNIADAGFEMIHGTYEKGIADFHSAYLGCMEAAR